MASVKVKQGDLRRLMKERREKETVKVGKIDSPLAKYNNIGQLSCVLCNVVIKTNNLWGSHIASKMHKENLLKPKKSNTMKVETKAAILGVKRNGEPERKKLKTDVKESTVDSQMSKTSLLAGYSSSDDSDSNSGEDTGSTVPVKSASHSKSVLPPDFFDNTPSISNATSTQNVTSQPTEETKESIPASSSAEALPEGFFDDPVLDAKARNIEYKDPQEEEWERFQKTIAEETNLSKTIIEEDLEESTLERDIDQIDEQIHQWERIKQLETLAEEVKTKLPEKPSKDQESGSTDEELEEDDLLDWRSKGVRKP